VRNLICVLILLTATAAFGQLTIYPSTDTIPQGTKLPMVCDPGSCTVSILSGGGSLDSAGNYIAPGSNTVAVIRATQGASHADATITVSGTLPTMGGDCSGGGPYPHSGLSINHCSFTHTETVGTATRSFNVAVPSRYVSGTSGLVINVGNTGHGIDNWCDENSTTHSFTKAGNETTGWGPYLYTVPSPAPVVACMNALFDTANTPEGWNVWGMDIPSGGWVFGGTPNDADALRKVIQTIVSDLNLDPRKVFITNDYRFSSPTMLGILNADLVAAIGVYSDILFVNTNTNFVVKSGVEFGGTTIPTPSQPISYLGIASPFAAGSNFPDYKGICGVGPGYTSSTIHPLNNDDIWTYFSTSNGVSSSTCGVTGSAMQSCSLASVTNFCNGYKTNGVGQDTTLDAKIGLGKAGTAVAVYKLRNNTVHSLPYTGPGWNGEDFTVCGLSATSCSNGSVNLDFSNTACTSSQPCSPHVTAQTGTDSLGLRYRFFLAHSKPAVTSGGGNPPTGPNPPTFITTTIL
jgi:hypothetical protein